MSKRQTIEEFYEKAVLHLDLFKAEINSSDELSEFHYEDDWWERFTEFSLELNKNE